MRDIHQRCIAVGFFDGVHLGHQAILKGADLALTFENHPLSLLAPERAPRLIMTSRERVKTIESLGVETVALDFDERMASMPPEKFIGFLESIVRSRGADKSSRLLIRSGANWRFGKGGAGDVEWAREHGIDIEVVPYAEHRGEPVSSTRIRMALERGDIAEANRMMGRTFGVRGLVFSGKGEGRRIGYPTINVKPLGESSVRLPLGVYAVSVGGAKGIANFGHAPTFASSSWSEPVWEIHLLSSVPSRLMPDLDFSVLGFIREERRFASIEELKLQIELDIESVREG